MKSYMSSPIDHKVLPDKILDYIRDKIITGKLKGGEKVSEAKLSDELRISRTPIREAVRLLECEGFVEIIPRKGAVVKKFSEEDILNTFEVKALIEALAVKHSSQKIDKIYLEKLEQIVQHEEEYFKYGNLKKFFKEFDKFTSLIIKFCSNNILMDLNVKVTNHIARYRFFCFKYPEILVNITDYHKKFIQLIKNKDFEKLRIEYEKYFLDIGKNMINQIKKI